MSVTIILILSAVLLLALVLRRQKSQGGKSTGKAGAKAKLAARVAAKVPGKTAQRSSSTTDKAKYKFHCTSVLGGKPHCAEVDKIKDKRFLAAEVPPLPIPGCSFAEGACHCRYAYHNDRRHIDRRNPYGATNNESIAAAGKQPRQRKDRRKTQHVYE